VRETASPRRFFAAGAWRVRSRISERWSSAKTASIPSMARPVGLVVRGGGEASAVALELLEQLEVST
jgi:hypothetical protein